MKSLPFGARLARKVGPLKHLRGWTRLLDCAYPLNDGKRYAFDTEVFGMRYRGDLGNIIDRRAYFYGAYEKEELTFVRDWWANRTGGVALDVGANAGHHALFFSQIFETVHAFEPNPSPRAEMEKRLADNRVSKVTAHPFGLWDSTTTLSFNIPPESNSGMGSFKDPIEGASTVTLNVRQGDELLTQLGIDQIDFLKIDVQGAEIEVINGLKSTLARSRPMIWVEVGTTNKCDFPTLSSITSFFQNQDYDAFCFTPKFPGLTKRSLKRVDEDLYKTLDDNLILVPR